MTVRIPISADAQHVQRALADIQAAIRRAGQEGKAFADLDLSHPELREFARDIEAATKRLEDLAKVGRGATAATVRRLYDGSGGNVVEMLHRLHAEAQRRYPDPNDAARFLANTGRYIFQGTRFALPTTPPVPMAPPPPGGGAGGGIPLPGLGAFTGGAATMLRGFLPAMLGMAGIQRVGAMVATGVSQAQQEAIGNDALLRTLRETELTFGTLRDRVRQAADGLGLTYQETQRLTTAWVRLTNETDSRYATGAVRFAAGMARGYGVDPTAMVQGLGRAQYLGEDPRRFALLLAEAVREGRMSGRVEETMDALLRWTETSARQMTSPGSVDAFAAAYAILSGSGIPGLRGQFGESLLHAMNAAATQGGAAGDASQFLTFRALSRAGVSDPYHQQYILAGGMFERVGGAGSPTVLEAMWGEIDTLYAGRSRFERYHALARHFGISPRQAAEFANAMTMGRMGALSSALGGMNLDLSQVDPTSIRDMAEIAGTSDLEGWRQRVLGGRYRLDATARARIQGASGEELREALIRALAGAGREDTEGTRVQQSQADLSNALTAASTALVPVLADMRASAALLGDGVGKLSGVLGDFYNAFVNNDQAAAARLSAGRYGAAAISGGVTGGAMSGFLDALEAVESAGGRQMVNARSSARGWHQFTDRTWLNVARRFGGDRISGLTEEQILALRYDRDFSRQMAEAHLQHDLGPELRGRGVDPGPLALYAGWHFGGDRGAAIMQAPANTPLSSLLSPAVLEANPHLRNMTAGEWRRRYGSRFNNFPMDDSSGGPAGTPAPAGPAAGSDERTDLSFHIAPLRVIHEGPGGDVRGVDFLPVTHAGSSRPWGIG